MDRFERLKDCRALVVGSNSEVAFEITKAIGALARGVVATYLEENPLRGVSMEQVQRELSQVTDFRAMQLDQTRRDQVEDIIGKAVGELGGIDVLVTAASAQSEGYDFTSIPWDQFRREVEVNQMGTLSVIQVTGNEMIRCAGSEARHRAIGVVGSVRGAEPLASTGYDAAKTALHGMVQRLAPVYGPHGITINAVAPGTIDVAHEPVRHGCSRDEYLERWKSLSPVGGRPVTPEQVANAMMALLDADWKSGQIEMVDAGFSTIRPLPQRSDKGE